MKLIFPRISRHSGNRYSSSCITYCEFSYLQTLLQSLWHNILLWEIALNTGNHSTKYISDGGVSLCSKLEEIARKHNHSQYISLHWSCRVILCMLLLNNGHAEKLIFIASLHVYLQTWLMTKCDWGNGPRSEYLSISLLRTVLPGPGINWSVWTGISNKDTSFKHVKAR